MKRKPTKKKTLLSGKKPAVEGKNHFIVIYFNDREWESLERVMSVTAFKQKSVFVKWVILKFKRDMETLNI